MPVRHGALPMEPQRSTSATVFLSSAEEQAEKNLHRELKDYNIKALAEAGRQIWNETLGRIQVEGGTEDDKTVFYSSFYRTFERPICMSEDGRYFSAFDGKVHEDNSTPFYTDDWIWDTYRAAHPLRTLIDQQKEEDIIASYLRMAEQMGNMWMPTFPEVTGDTRRMNSNSCRCHGSRRTGQRVESRHGKSLRGLPERD